MPQYDSNTGMRVTVLALGLATGAFALILANFGDTFVDPDLVRRSPLLYIIGVLGIAGGLAGMVTPALAGLLLIVTGACWLGLAFALGYGATLATMVPLLGAIIGVVVAFSAAGASAVLETTDRLSIWVGKIFATTIVILTVVVCYEVFMRYVLRMPTRWAYDAGYMLYGAGFIMAGAYALAQNAHVRADVIYRFWRPRIQASIDLVLFILFFFPATFFFIYQGYIFAERSWIMGEFSSASPFNIPVYHYKTLIPLAGMMLFLQGIGELFRVALCLRDGQWPPRVSDVAEIDEKVQKGEVPLSVAGALGTDVTLDTPGAVDGRRQ